ncbi:major capsid protein [Tortoise microvirus 104]|nr:major capsid protein [Tortoise microvirus 6]QCS37449.1 major capsid protein [Tortoise microvirus 104]
MNQTLESIDSGSNYSFYDKMQPASYPRSMFNLSHLYTCTIDNAGALIPVLCIPTLPTDSFDISVSALLRVMPQVVPPMSRQRLYFHGFYCRDGDLWCNFNTFMKKGYSGNVLKQVPTIKSSTWIDGESSTATVTPNSVANYLGLPIGLSFATKMMNKISALPFFMYLKIWRDYYMNKNFYIDNSVILPDDDGNFRLGDNGRLLTNPSGRVPDELLLGRMLYRDYPSDYFTSALPFQQRGNAPTLDTKLVLNTPADIVGYDAATGVVHFDNTFISTQVGSKMMLSTSSNNTMSISTDGTASATISSPAHSRLGVNFAAATVETTITLDTIRQLAIAQTELEKMARTDGSYAEFGLTFYGRQSKTAVDYKPLYIGGTYQSIAFTEVLQTTPTENSPLGTFGGHGISSQQNGYIGHLDCDDYGYLMIIASIMPDVYYSQGIDKHWTDLLQSDFFLPGREKLGLVPILNRELYALSTSSSLDDDLFAYQSPFDTFRYLPNVIRGKIADITNESFSPYTQARIFSTMPTYSQSFARADNVRKDYLSAPSENAYIMQAQFDIRAVRPLPYKAEPASII